MELKKASNNEVIKPSEDGIDRISNLPDSLISKILSLLLTENAVATSTLSRRWKFFWTSITTLNLVQERPKKSVSMKKTKFIVFVNRVIMLVTPPCIHKFRLNFTHLLFDPIHLQMWISVIAQTVQELDLYLRSYGNPFELQMNYFRFNKLVILKLKGKISFKIPPQASVCFPNLHTLHLSHIRLSIAPDSSVSFPKLMSLHFYDVINENEELFDKLFSSCPVVQEIYIHAHHIRRYFTTSRISINTPSLTSLQLVVLNLAGADIDFKIPPKAFVRFPNLQQLHLSEITFSIPNDSFISFPNLKILCFRYVENCANEESVQKLISSCPVLNDLYIRFRLWTDLLLLLIRIPSPTKLQLLSISGQVFSVSGQVLKAVENAFTDFYNLKSLELDVYNCSELSLVINKLLICMENLGHLAIRMNYRSCSCANTPWSQPLNVPKGLAWCVMTISFDQISENCNRQLEFLRYILKNARVLQLLKLGIHSYCNSDKRNQLVKKISKFPKMSQACQVKFM